MTPASFLDERKAGKGDTSGGGPVLKEEVGYLNGASSGVLHIGLELHSNPRALLNDQSFQRMARGDFEIDG